jgi:hypothetical protein
MKRLWCLGGLFVLMFAGVAGAAIITPSSIAFVGTGVELAGLNLDNENNLINGTGLSEPLAADESNLATVTHAAVSFNAPGNAWVTTDPNGGAGDYFDPAGNGGTIIFDIDLGDLHTVDSFTSWGYHFGVFGGNAISNVTLEFSTDGGVTIDSSQTIGVPFGATPGSSVTVALVPTPANFITMTVNDNHFGGGFPGGDRVGLAEIVFTNNVPEPGAWMLALAAASGLFAFGRAKR